MHHTSFLWDFDARNMALLQLPEKRPSYRGDRDHADFVTSLSQIGSGGGGGGAGGGREVFLDALEEHLREEWDLRPVALEEALEVAARPQARERQSNDVVHLPAAAAAAAAVAAARPA